MRAVIPLRLLAVLVLAARGAVADPISLFDQHDLDRRGIESIETLQYQVPSWLAGGGLGSLALRGVGGQVDGPAADPGFAVRLDGVYLSRLAPLRTGFHDIDRIEVARGPRGSLAGRNTAGVMNAIPRRAGFDSELDFDVEYGNRESLRTRGMLNLPILEDVLALRIAVQHERNGGFYHQLAAGDRVYDARDTTVRASLRLDSTEALSFDLSYTLIDRSGAGDDSKLQSNPRPSGTGGLLLDDFTGALPTPPSARLGRENRRGDVDDRVHLVSLRGSFAPSEVLSIESTTAYQQHTASRALDADHTELDIRSESQFADLYAISQDLELRVRGEGRFSGVLGANVFFEKHAGTGSDSLAVQQTAAFRSLDPGLPEDRLRLDARGENLSWDVYGDLAIELTSAWSIQGGVRASGMDRDSRDRSEQTDLILVLGLPAFARTTGVDQSKTWTAVTWRVGTTFELSERTRVHATVSTGSRAGGFHFLQLGAFDEEDILAVEMGARSRSADGRWSLGANLFWYDYEDIQVLVHAGDITSVANVPEAEILGAEIEWLAIPIDEVRWNGSFGYLFAEYGAGGPIAVEGNRLVRAPEFSLNSGLEYRYEISSRAGSLTLRGDYTFRDSVDFDPMNEARFRSGRTHIGDLRAIYESEWNAYGLQVEAFVMNVADQTVATNIASSSAGLHEVGFYNTPRLYGGRLTASF
jgi:iron complex outermembrane receptor protein